MPEATAANRLPHRRVFAGPHQHDPPARGVPVLPRLAADAARSDRLQRRAPGEDHAGQGERYARFVSAAEAEAGAGAAGLFGGQAY